MKIREIFAKVSMPEMMGVWDDAQLPDIKLDEVRIPHYQLRMWRDKFVIMGEALSFLMGKKDWNLLDLVSYLSKKKGAN